MREVHKNNVEKMKAKNERGLTLTWLFDCSANFGESLGNTSEIQKIAKNGKYYGIRTNASMKNAIVNHAGLYDKLKLGMDGKVVQRVCDVNNDIAKWAGLEAGCMDTKNATIRKASFYLSDAVSFEPYECDTRFSNNLGLATLLADRQTEETGKEVKSSEAGLMPYSKEIDKNLKKCSITFDLDRVGYCETKGVAVEITPEEKIARIKSLVMAIKDCPLTVCGFRDTTRPEFMMFSIGNDCKSPIFDRVIEVKKGKFILGDSLKEIVENHDCVIGINDCSSSLENAREVKAGLNATTIDKAFALIEEKINNLYK